MREAEVVAAFVACLQRHGWTTRLEVDWVDIVAERGADTVLIEAKGTTTQPGLDVDTAYGQLLRRMRTDPSTSYALVVPAHVAKAALRVPEHVLSSLRIAVYSVATDAAVAHEGGTDRLLGTDR